MGRSARSKVSMAGSGSLYLRYHLSETRTCEPTCSPSCKAWACIKAFGIGGLGGNVRVENKDGDLLLDSKRSLLNLELFERS